MNSSETTSVILLSIDALRADHLGYHGYDRETSPFLDQLSERVLSFTTAISASSHTREAVPALLSGRYPDRFAANGYRYVPEIVSDRLSDAGYYTAGFHSNPYISRAYGYESGFDTFDDDLLLGQNRLFALAQRAIDKFFLNKGDYHARAEHINDKSLSWLDTREDGPFFLWNHYMDPHGPYNPSEEYTYADRELSNKEAQSLYQKTIDHPEELTETERQLLIDSYDGEIRHLDDQLRVFFDSLEERGLLEESLVIITADHGDAFGEHGYFTHPRYLHEELIHIPMLVSPPKEISGTTVESPVSTLDVVPTILEYASLSSDELPGDPLVSNDGITEREDDYIVFSSATGEDDNEGVRRFSARGPRWKAILERDIESGDVITERVFDLKEDPREQDERSASEVNVRGLIDELLSFSDGRLNAVIDDETDDVTTEQSDEINERLEALGYK